MPVMPRPLVVGLLQVDADAACRDLTAVRVAMALAVNERGYALLDVLSLGLGATQDGVALALVEELAVLHDVQVLVLCGVVDEVPVRRLADRVRLAVWVLSVAGR